MNVEDLRIYKSENPVNVEVPFRHCFSGIKTVDATDTRKAVDPMEGFLKSVDKTVDQVPFKVKEG